MEWKIDSSRVLFVCVHYAALLQDFEFVLGNWKHFPLGFLIQ